MNRLAVALSLLALAGCHKKATCEDAVHNLAKLGGSPKDEVADKIRQCQEEKPSQAMLDCIAGAKSKDALAKCVDTEAASRYIDKSKAVEARMGVLKIARGAQMYYEENNQLPAAAGPTPAPGSCCKGADGKCAPDAQAWSAPGWQALQFDMLDPHRCWYTFEASGSGASAAFTARANCDLDCDGEYSTFELVGKVGADGTLEVPREPFIEKETE